MVITVFLIDRFICMKCVMLHQCVRVLSKSLFLTLEIVCTIAWEVHRFDFRKENRYSKEGAFEYLVVKLCYCF